jgi:hypothetical protein
MAWLPEERPSAEELLYDEWIRGDDYWSIFSNPEYYRKREIKTNT